MGGLLPLNGCCCFNLRTGTLISLWLCLILPILNFLVSVVIIVRANLEAYDDISGSLNYVLLRELPILLILEFIPFAVGLYGTYQRNPSFLMVAVLDVFVITGFYFRNVVQMMNDRFYGSILNNILGVVNIVMLWYFALVWYSYSYELKKQLKSNQRGNDPLNSV